MATHPEAQHALCLCVARPPGHALGSQRQAGVEVLRRAQCEERGVCWCKGAPPAEHPPVECHAGVELIFWEAHLVREADSVRDGGAGTL